MLPDPQVMAPAVGLAAVAGGRGAARLKAGRLGQVVVVVEHVGPRRDLRGAEVLGGDGGEQVELRVRAADHAVSAAARAVGDQHDADAARPQAEQVEHVVRHREPGQPLGLVEELDLEAEVEEPEHDDPRAPDGDEAVLGNAGGAGARDGNAARPEIELDATAESDRQPQEQQLVVADRDLPGRERQRGRREQQPLVGGPARHHFAPPLRDEARDRERGLFAASGRQRVGGAFVLPADEADLPPIGREQPAPELELAGRGARRADPGEPDQASRRRQRLIGGRERVGLPVRREHRDAQREVRVLPSRRGGELLGVERPPRARDDASVERSRPRVGGLHRDPARLRVGAERADPRLSHRARRAPRDRDADDRRRQGLPDRERAPDPATHASCLPRRAGLGP